MPKQNALVFSKTGRFFGAKHRLTSCKLNIHDSFDPVNASTKRLRPSFPHKWNSDIRSGPALIDKALQFWNFRSSYETFCCPLPFLLFFRLQAIAREIPRAAPSAAKREWRQRKMSAKSGPGLTRAMIWIRPMVKRRLIKKCLNKKRPRLLSKTGRFFGAKHRLTSCKLNIHDSFDPVNASTKRLRPSFPHKWNSDIRSGPALIDKALQFWNFRSSYETFCCPYPFSCSFDFKQSLEKSQERHRVRLNANGDNVRWARSRVQDLLEQWYE